MLLSDIISACKLDLAPAKDIQICALNSLASARRGELAFAIKDCPELASTKASAVLCSAALASKLPDDCLALICEDAKYYFALISALFIPASPTAAPNISPSATIEPGAVIKNAATIGDDSRICSGAIIGENVTIGKRVLVHSGAVIYANSIIGDDCIIHANAVIGSDGFGYASNARGHTKIHHLGRVEIEPGCEIGACVCIDRAVFERTLIKAGSKIDNLVQIGHNCELGRGCIIVSQTGLAGSSILGDGVVMGGQSATSGHLKIASYTTIAARGGVSKSIDKAGTYAGFPLHSHRDWLRLNAAISRAYLKQN